MPINLSTGVQGNAILLLWATLFWSSLCVQHDFSHMTADYWTRNGQEHLHMKIRSQRDTLALRNKVAKNVIVFIGDGMGVSTVTATRIYKNQQAGGAGEENPLSFEKFPFVGLSKVYEIDYQVPDSAGTATAILSGVKVLANMAGLDLRAKYQGCERASNEAAKLENIMSWAQKAGKYTGFVTTTRVTHATLAAAYAHINDRYWECDSKVPLEHRDCVKDVARQLVEDEPGRNLNVVLGGGLNQMGVPVHQPPDAYKFCTREDGQNLVEKWKQGRHNYLFVNTTNDLMSADLSKVEHLMGLFSPGHLPYVSDRDGEPSLTNMTAQALKLLSRNPKGYVLLVEGGNIDNAHHDGTARRAIQETADMSDAVEYVVSATNPENTLIVVTADHSHTLTIAGYPPRGSDIFGSDNIFEDLKGHDALTYANGPGSEFHKSKNCSEGYWRKVTDEERKDPAYLQFAGKNLGKETHAGEDVAVYAYGPQANLLSGVYEQHYIAHVICYAACIGPQATYCDDIKVPEFGHEGESSRQNTLLESTKSSGTTLSYTFPHNINLVLFLFMYALLN